MAPIRQILEASVRFSDLQNEDLQATALRTLADQAIGVLPLDNPSLASVLVRGLPAQINESLSFFSNEVIETDGFFCTRILIHIRVEHKDLAFL